MKYIKFHGLTGGIGWKATPLKDFGLNEIPQNIARFCRIVQRFCQLAKDLRYTVLQYLHFHLPMAGVASMLGSPPFPVQRHNKKGRSALKNPKF